MFVFLLSVPLLPLWRAHIAFCACCVVSEVLPPAGDFVAAFFFPREVTERNDVKNDEKQMGYDYFLESMKSKVSSAMQGADERALESKEYKELMKKIIVSG